MTQPKGGLLLALVAAGGVIAGAGITAGVNYVGHQHDLDAKMIELSVGILRAEPTPETNPLREWAIDVIDKRAKFSFNTAQRAALLKRPLPFKGKWQESGGYDDSNDGRMIWPPALLPKKQSPP